MPACSMLAYVVPVVCLPVLWVPVLCLPLLWVPDLLGPYLLQRGGRAYALDGDGALRDPGKRAVTTRSMIFCNL